MTVKNLHIYSHSWINHKCEKYEIIILFSSLSTLTEILMQISNILFVNSFKFNFFNLFLKFSLVINRLNFYKL